MSIANSAHHSMIGKVAGGIKFIPYAASDGTACIVVPHVTQDVQNGKLYIRIKSPPNFSYLNGKNLFGYSRRDSNFLLNNYNDAYRGGRLIIYSGNTAVCWFLYSTWLSSNQAHDITITKQGRAIIVNVDGVQAASGNAGTTTPVKGRYGLLTQNDIDGDAVNPISGRTPTEVAVAAFDTWDGDTLATSLRPCIDPNGVVCFFDLVSNQYIYSVSGGSFVAVYQ